METESQKTKIKHYLQSGKSLTSLDALYMFNCFRLGARVWQLKQEGLKIKSEMIEITSPSVFDGKKKVAKYSLIK